jgi:hypothetical protein
MITVCSVTGVDFQGHMQAIERTQLAIPHFTRSKFIPMAGMTKDEYSKFIVNRLNHCIDTEFVLICQADGYGIHRELWSDEFLQWDYVGAPWPNGQQGNGGLSLRSKRFLEASAALPEPDLPEDAYLCQYHREELEAKGIRFAPLEVAIRFSFEHPVDGMSWNSDDSWGRHFPK